jgi:predicted transcriptional regulator
MTTKREAIQMIERMPEEASLEDIFAELYFKMKVEQGLADVAAGRVVTDDEARKRFAKWLNSPGR